MRQYAVGSLAKLSRVCNTLRAYGGHDWRFSIIRVPYLIPGILSVSLPGGVKRAVPAGVFQNPPGHTALPVFTRQNAGACMQTQFALP